MAEWKSFKLDSDVPTCIVPRRTMKMRNQTMILGPTIAAELRAWCDWWDAPSNSPQSDVVPISRGIA